MSRALNEQLLKAARDGDSGTVEKALADGADVNGRGEFGDTALNIAAQGGHRELVEQLIDAGADIENRGGADMTPLMNATVGGHVGVVRILLGKGARVSDDLLRSVELKVSILRENAEAGMVRPDAVDAWQQFLDMLVAARPPQ